jgi:hypothetical protein
MHMASEFQFDVYLCYSSKDKPLVRRLAHRLKRAGLRVWFDEWNIRLGDIIALKLDEGLEQSRVLLMCVSPNALASGWVALERSTAIHRDPANADRSFIPVMIADCEMPITLRRYKCLDFREEVDTAFEELLSDCQLGTGEAPQAVMPLLENAPKKKSWWKMWFAPGQRFPGYMVVGEPFGEGAYGKVRLVRNATGQLQALKEITRERFDDMGPYDREFHGIKNYKPFSNQHLGLLHIDHVNRNDEDGYFYYVMELGDALDPGWELNGKPYQPRDLARSCGEAEGGRLPARECIRIGIALLEALDFLHQHGLVHRDVKPANIIFVNGRPKLADVGLIHDVKLESELIGTEFYMPPPPEPPGTIVADIYALGKVLYVISTGKSAKSFAELSRTLVGKPEFMRLNEIICQACQPTAAQRYQSASVMLIALRNAQSQLDADHK